MKHKRLIYTYLYTNTEVYLDIVRVLSESQKAEVSEVGL